MAARVVNAVSLTCDTCGAESSSMIGGVTSARIAAAAKGWKFVEWDVRGMNKYATGHKRREEAYLVPKRWDCRPACQLPADPHEARKIREAR